MDALHTATRSRVTDDMMSLFEHRSEQFMSFARGYHEDPDVRLQAENAPHALLREHGLSVKGNVDVRILANTDDVFYLLMPPDPNIELADEDLGVVAAGGKSAASAGSASTVSSVATCLASVASAATASSAS
jgi:hypothetical protein